MLIGNLISSVFLLFSSVGMAQATAPKVVDGDYRVELTIGDKVFVDQMTLKGQDRPMALQDFQGEFVGSMTVPGVFTSPLIGSGYCTDRGPVCNLGFSIVANENGQTYQVNYTAVVDANSFNNYRQGLGPLIIRGTATLENGSVLGDYVAIKQEP